MKIKLNTVERLTLLGLLPARENFATLKVIRELRKRVEFDVKEIKNLNLKQEKESMKWDAGKEKMKEVDFGKYEMELVAQSLKELDEKKELTDQHYSLYEKFVEAK